MVNKAEIKRINDFLKDVQEGIFEGYELATMQIRLTELYTVIKTLTEEIAKVNDQKIKTELARLQKRAWGYKQEIEGMLAVRD